MLNDAKGVRSGPNWALSDVLVDTIGFGTVHLCRFVVFGVSGDDFTMEHLNLFIFSTKMGGLV